MLRLPHRSPGGSDEMTHTGHPESPALARHQRPASKQCDSKPISHAMFTLALGQDTSGHSPQWTEKAAVVGEWKERKMSPSLTNDNRETRARQDHEKPACSPGCTAWGRYITTTLHCCPTPRWHPRAPPGPAPRREVHATSRGKLMAHKRQGESRFCLGAFPS